MHENATFARTSIPTARKRSNKATDRFDGLLSNKEGCPLKEGSLFLGEPDDQELLRLYGALNSLCLSTLQIWMRYSL